MIYNSFVKFYNLIAFYIVGNGELKGIYVFIIKSINRSHLIIPMISSGIVIIIEFPAVMWVRKVIHTEGDMVVIQIGIDKIHTIGI